MPQSCIGPTTSTTTPADAPHQLMMVFGGPENQLHVPVDCSRMPDTVDCAEVEPLPRTRPVPVAPTQ